MTVEEITARKLAREAAEMKPDGINFEKSGASPTINELAGALAKAQALFQPAAKNKTNPHLKSKYADLVSVTEAVKKPLSDNGLSYVQLIEGERSEITCITTLLHLSGQWIASRLTLHSKDTTPQAMGSAITYARRYGLSAMLGIVTDEEDDGEAAQPKPEKAKDPKYGIISTSEPKPIDPPKKVGNGASPGVTPGPTPAAATAKVAPSVAPAAKSHDSLVSAAQETFAGAKTVADTRKPDDGAPLADEAKDDLWDLVCQVWPSDAKHALNEALKARKLKPVVFKTLTVGEAATVRKIVSELLGNDGDDGVPF